MHQAFGGQQFTIDTPVLRAMLGHAQYIGCACDLDLLLFFHRHPCALLAGEQIFARLGYGCQQAAVSLEGLVEAGVVKRSRSRAATVCLYLLETAPFEDDALPSLLRIAATPEGRRSVMRLLKSGADSGKAASLAPPTAPDRGMAA